MNRLALAAALGLMGCARPQVPVAPAPSEEPVAVQSPPAEAPTPAPQPPDEMVRAGPIHFGLDSSTLTDDAQRELQHAAELLGKHGELAVVVAGHTCELGTTEYNAQLGARRATVAKEYLLKLGVEPKRIHTVSYGEERPADARHLEEAWQANRRDELEFGAPRE